MLSPRSARLFEAVADPDVVGGYKIVTIATDPSPFDYAKQSAYQIEVSASDGNKADVATFTISVDPAPVDQKASFTLSAAASSLAEDADTTDATSLATITITDDGLGTNTLSFTAVDNNGNDSSALFEIVGGALRLKAGASLDYETSTSYTVTVSLDSSGEGDAPAAQPFTLTVTDVNEAPVAPDVNITDDVDIVVSKGGIFNVSLLISNLASKGIVRDPEGDDLIISITTAPSHGTFKKSNGDGTYEDLATLPDFTAATVPTDVVYVHDGGTALQDTIVITYNDGTDETQQTLTLDINQPPTTQDGAIADVDRDAYVFSADDFAFTDDNTAKENGRILITGLPTAGSLVHTYDPDADPAASREVDLSGGGYWVSIADITAGHLKWVRGASVIGDEVTFTYKVDDGHVLSEAEATLTFQ